jgi:hypothetical protein
LGVLPGQHEVKKVTAMLAALPAVSNHWISALIPPCSTTRNVITFFNNGIHASSIQFPLGWRCQILGKFRERSPSLSLRKVVSHGRNKRINGILPKLEYNDPSNETGGAHVIKAVDTVAHRAQGDGVECKAGKVFGGLDGIL